MADIQSLLLARGNADAGSPNSVCDLETHVVRRSSSTTWSILVGKMCIYQRHKLWPPKSQRYLHTYEYHQAIHRNLHDPNGLPWCLGRHSLESVQELLQDSLVARLGQGAHRFQLPPDTGALPPQVASPSHWWANMYRDPPPLLGSAREIHGGWWDLKRTPSLRYRHVHHYHHSGYQQLIWWVTKHSLCIKWDAGCGFI